MTIPEDKFSDTFRMCNSEFEQLLTMCSLAPGEEDELHELWKLLIEVDFLKQGKHQLLKRVKKVVHYEDKKLVLYDPLIAMIAKCDFEEDTSLSSVKLAAKDLTPTICEVAGFKQNEPFKGKGNFYHKSVLFGTGCKQDHIPITDEEQPLKLELWMTIMKIIGQDRTNGDTDRNTQSNSKWTHTWNNVPMFKKSSSLHLPQGSGQDIIAEGILSEFHPLQRHLQPSPRPSNWLENKALYTKQKRHTKLHWNGYLRDSSKKTHHQHHNWHYQL